LSTAPSAEPRYVVPGSDGRGLRHTISRLRSYLFWDPLVFFYTAVFGVVSLVASLFDSDGRMQHAIARKWARLILATIGIHIETRGVESTDWSQPYVIAANHLSSFDIPLLYACLPTSFRIVAKVELFKIPFLGWHLRRSGQLPVDEKNARASFRSLHKAVEAIKGGHPVVIFPEGGRSPHGRMLPFMSGPFYLAVKAHVPILPVAIMGTYETLPMNTFHIMPHPFKLVVGKPIASEGHSIRDLDALSSEVEGAIRGLMEG